MRPLFRRMVFAAVVLLALPAAARAQSTSELFNPDVLQNIELWLNGDDWDKLKENFQSDDYYPADVVWNGITVRNVGIRSRGAGSRRASKPGLLVDMDYYVTNQTFLGLKSFVLDNLAQDPSGIRETTAMRLMERLGIPASREAHARLYVRGRYVGLYAVVETVNKSFLARIFGEINGDVQNDGYLYEYRFTSPWRFTYLGSSLQPYKTRFDAKTHEDKSDETKWRRIEEIARLVNELRPDQYMEQLHPRLDLRQFIRFVAAQNFVAENDGFLGYDGMNNFYFYRKENSEQHVFIAWDLDNAFWGPEFPLTERHDDNVLFRKAMEVGELRDLYYATLDEAARIADTADGADLPWLETEVRRRLDLIADAVRDDPNGEFWERHNSDRNLMIIFARERGRFVRSNLPR